MKRQSHIIRTEQDRAALVGMMNLVPLSKPLKVTVEEVRKQRSLSANSLYWKWMQEAGDHLGYDKDEMDDVCKEVADCPVSEIHIDGKVIARRSTKALTDADMSAYMDRCYRRLSEYGCVLTLPEMAHAS